MFKKFTTLFSLVVMMSTFAVTPISAATQAASTDTTVSQATTEQSNHTDVAKEETTAATTLPATSDKSSLIPTTQNQKATNQITNAQAQSRAPALRATDWGDQFVTHAELEDENGNPKTDFGIYDNMQAHWDYNIPAGTAIKSGDTMSVNVPSVLALQSDVTFDIKDAAGNVIGHAVADHTTGKVTITFTDYAETSAKNGINGDFNIWVHWNHSQVEEDTDVPIDWGTNGQTIHVDPDGNPTPDPNEVLYKWGTVDSNDPTLIHWTVRLNLTQEEIKNGVYTDFIGENQQVVHGTVAAMHGSYNATFTDFIKSSDVPTDAISYDSDTQFHINIGDFSDTVLINYDSRATDGGQSSKYENSGQLTGDNIEKQTVDIYTPDNGGGGGGETTETVSGTKTWQDDNNAEGLRPDAIIVDLYQNGVKIDSKSVSEETNWQYSFTNLPKYDADANAYTYTVKEEAVDHYTSQQDGNNFTNTLSDTTSVSGTKTWDDQNNQDGSRPDAIKVNLLANGQIINTKTVTAKDNWQYSFTNLQKYDTNGKKIVYTVTEDKVSGYKTEVSGFDIINHHTPTPTP
ncbi:Cna B-type domain-containing protein, partial [Leuconostoc falkenbergense]|uniref:Cna B-type domain-containing protein n=1 Tax=Leuconostoc falkenbergense TaxID=2766470 RepID=UPI0039E74D73